VNFNSIYIIILNLLIV